LALIAFFVLYVVNPAWLSWFSIALPSGVRWLGAGLGAAGLILLVWVHQTLGKYWSATLQLKKEHALVTSGPYRWVRHPMYTALVLLFVGLFLVSALWLFLLLVVASVLLFCRVIDKEEAMMVEQFGEEYRRYMERTGRFLPCFVHRSD
jgi:protein-S-isoprenylcysteine O-methyltransferase Ste14